MGFWDYTREEMVSEINNFLTIDQVTAKLNKRLKYFYEADFHEELFLFGYSTSRRNNLHDRFIKVYSRRLANYIYSESFTWSKSVQTIKYHDYSEYYKLLGYMPKKVLGEYR